MTHTFQNQIEAIQKARRIIKIYYMGNDIQEFDAKLNDAGSTIAALNLSDPYKKIERFNMDYKEALKKEIEKQVGLSEDDLDTMVDEKGRVFSAKDQILELLDTVNPQP